MHDMAIVQTKKQLSLAVPVSKMGISSTALKCYETDNGMLISYLTKEKLKIKSTDFSAVDYVQGRILNALIFAK